MNILLHRLPQHDGHPIPLPEAMNNPLDYEPHPLCIEACRELQAYLSQRKDWREEIDHGKMFGILIVESKEDEVGYLAAYSGQIGGRSNWQGFVPAVFDYLQPDGYFKQHEAEITRINHAIAKLQTNEQMAKAKQQINLLEETRRQTIANYQAKMKQAKAQRDALRQAGNLSAETEQALIKESQFMKAELKRLKKSLAEKTTLETEYEDYQENLTHLKRLRKQLSDTLQQWLFSQFRMLNPQGERKDLLEIFRDAALMDGTQAKGMKESLISQRTALKMIPPAGSGECCEPKLLQYAYEQGYKPRQMAMFWWGESPKEEIRHHLQFYPACNGKCKPILHWMLPETTQKKASHPYLPSKETNMRQGKETEEEIEILWEDQQLAVICKPAGMLSVPGKDTSVPSVYSIMRKKYREATGPLIVHRLDMATSGLMVIAKTEFAYHRLQEQFANHQISKKYVAIVCGKDFPRQGTITLPLMPDYLDRPRQIVSHAHGKEAITRYEVTEEHEGRRRLALYPKTGRTHQLRVHCAHQEGLNAPIWGDPLYGNERADRLYLHAESIRFKHPLTGAEIYIERKADF